MIAPCTHLSERTAQGTCILCQRPACSDCLVELAGQPYCKACLNARVTSPPRSVHGLLRLVLSVAPGLGHLYMGLFQRGFQIMVGTVLGAVLVGLVFPPLLGLWIPMGVFFSIFDAREAHLRLVRGLEVRDLQLVDLQAWHPRWVAYGLITLGGVGLYNTLLNDVLYLLFGRSQQYFRVVGAARGITLAAAAICLGLWLLRRERAGSAAQSPAQSPVRDEEGVA